MPKRNPGPRLKFREKSGNWEIVWYEKGCTRSKSTGTSDHAEATRQLSEHLAGSLSDPSVIGPQKPEDRLISDMLADYALEHGPDVVGKETLALGIKALLPFWGSLRVRDIREGTCKAFVRFRAQPGAPDPKTGRRKPGVKPATAGRNLSILKAAIKHDYDAGRLTEMVACWRPGEPDAKDRWLTRDEAAKLIRAARRDPRSRWHLPLFILTALYTAARKEALLSLRWPQVDLKRRLIDLNPPGRERTSKGRPMLPIPEKLLIHLRYAKKRGSDLGPVLHYLGKPILNIRKGFESACANAGLDDVTPHTLRHTSASWMAQAGVPFPIIARYLGHADSRITEKKYCHHAADYLSAAVEALDRRPRR